ncbi:hypothetical protein K4P50_11000 [Staphylococcus epidermidis]|nr:hypothetical protein [Staphylococcus epidermidis]
MISTNYDNAKSKLLNLIRTDYKNLIEDNPKADKDKLVNKTYRRHSSINKTWRTYKKYELKIPHEELVPSAIPFFFRKVKTNPSSLEHAQAQCYIEKYAELDMALKTVTKKEKEKLFEGITKENLKRIM